MAMSKETYEKAYSLIKRSDRVLLCVNNRSTFDNHLAGAALYLYLKDLEKDVCLCVNKCLKTRPKKIYKDFAVNYDTELKPMRYVISLDHSDGAVDSVRYDDKNGKFNLYITPSGIGEEFDFKNVSYSGGGIYDLLIIMGARKLEHLGDIYLKNKKLFDDGNIICINNIVSKGFGKINLTSTEIPVCEIVYNLVCGEFSSKSVNEIINLLLMGILDELQIFNKSDFKITTIEVMTSLIKMGADIKDAFREVYFKKGPKFVKVLQQVLENVKLDRENGIAWSKVDYQDFSKIGIERHDFVLDGNISFNISDDFNVAFVLYEVSNGEVWIELESNVDKISAMDVLFQFKPSGNDYRALAISRNLGVGQVENIVMTRIKSLSVSLLNANERPDSKDILTNKYESVHNSPVLQDQGLVTPPPLSPTQ